VSLITTIIMITIKSNNIRSIIDDINVQ